MTGIGCGKEASGSDLPDNVLPSGRLRAYSDIIRGRKQLIGCR